MGSSTYTTLGVVEESTLGTTPASALRLVNCTATMSMDRDAQRPEIWTGTQRRYPSRPMREGGTVTVDAPWQYENCLEFQEGLFGVARSSAVSISGTGIAFTTGTITDTGNGLAGVLVGDWVYIGGVVTATGNNGWHGPVTASAAGTLTFPASTFTAESAGATITIKTRRLIEPASATLKTYSLECSDSDVTSFESAKAACVSSATWSWAVGGWATEQYQLTTRLPARAGSTIGTGAATAAKTSPFLNVPTDWGNIYYGSATASTAIWTKMEVQCNVNLEAIMGNGDLGPSTYSRGPLDWSLSGSVYLNSDGTAFLDNALSHATKYIAWDVVDPAGNKIFYFFPASKIDIGNIERGAPNTQKTVSFSATSHSSSFDSSATFSGIAPQAAIFFVPA